MTTTDDRRMVVEEREEFFAQASRYTPFLAVRTEGGVFFVRTKDGHIGKSLFAKQERGEQRMLKHAGKFLEDLFGPDAVAQRDLIDVGANIGTTCISAIRASGFGRAVACEPERDNFRDLRLNILLNRLERRITALNVAVTNYVGTCELEVVRHRGGKHFVATDNYRQELDQSGKSPSSTNETVTVDTVTLDSLAQDGIVDPERTGLLWMDVEGSEGHALEGATALVERGVPVLMEVNPRLLKSLGGLERVHSVAAQHYTHFVDARRLRAPEVRESRDLPDFTAGYLDPNAPAHFTDIVMLRLTSKQARTLQKTGK